ncbi:MAG: hypothetical protein QGH60_07580 [Phycisphaerae bacterium]|jgi:hypothetical protein|nr:hypothetical protein [Phycisphaerae bacterium]
MNQVIKYAIVLSLTATVLLSAVPCMAIDDAPETQNAPASRPAGDYHHRAQGMRGAVIAISKIMCTFLAVAVGLSLLIVVQLLFPGLTTCGTEALRKGLFRSFLLGAAVLVVLVAIVYVAALASKPLGGVLAIVLMTFLVLITFPMVSQDMGRRIFARSGANRGPVAQLAVGWLVFAGASITPILGWFIIFPFLTLAGIGALVQTFWTSKPQTPAAEIAEEPTQG